MPDAAILPQNTAATTMNAADAALQAFLEQRRHDLSIRALEQNDHLIDFASNDYLSLSRSAWLKQEIIKDMQGSYRYHPDGATGSRLISGNHAIYEQLERRIADHHRAEAALLFNSGYDANLGFFSAVPQHGDLILADELVHASIRDGLKLTRGTSQYFLHNDLNELEGLLKCARGTVFIIVEAVYSMDGDFAPLKELVAMAKKYGAHLVVDEAHAVGLFGPAGAGRVVELGLEKEVYARIITYGKAFGSHGAAVIGSAILKQFLINYARSFIFTTALPLYSVLRLNKVYDILSNGYNRSKVINNLCGFVEKGLEGLVDARLLPGNSQIKSLVIPGNDNAKAVSVALKEAGIYAKAILYPTVPRGKERLRICVHAHNTKQEVDLLVSTIRTVIQ